MLVEVDLFDPSAETVGWGAEEKLLSRQPAVPAWDHTYEHFDASARMRRWAQQVFNGFPATASTSCVGCAVVPTAVDEAATHQQATASPAGWDLSTIQLPDPSSVGSVERGGVAAQEERLADQFPPEAQIILDTLSPYLGPVAEAITPLLQAQGLSASSASVADVLSVDGLADAIMEAAQQAVARVRAVDSLTGQEQGSSRDSSWKEPRAGLPMGWDQVQEIGEQLTPADRETPDELDVPGWDAGLPPLMMDGTPPKNGFSRQKFPSLAYDLNGDPCYPDAPPFEDYWPKCTELVDEEESEGNCKTDYRFRRADERLKSYRHFRRIPKRFRRDETEDNKGYDYREELEKSVAFPATDLYDCRLNISTNNLAQWDSRPDRKVIAIYEPFLTLLPFNAKEAWILGPIDFRAGTLLHEHVHRIEDADEGTVPPPPDITYKPIGSQGQTCPLSGTEYNGAYIQARYYGGTRDHASMLGEIYSLKQCTDLSKSARILAAADVVVKTLALEFLEGILIVTAFGALYLGFWFTLALGLLDDLLPNHVAMFLLLTVLGL